VSNTAGHYVVFDLEGNADRTNQAEHEIIEIGAVRVVDGIEVATFQSFVRPFRKLRKQTTELTGLTDADLESAPTLAEALSDFYRFVSGAPLIAHNGVGYDFKLLDAT